MIIKCNRCEGSGKEPIDKEMAVFTLGITAVFDWMDPDTCSKCDGNGVVKIDEEDLNS